MRFRFEWKALQAVESVRVSGLLDLVLCDYCSQAPLFSAVSEPSRSHFPRNDASLLALGWVTLLKELYTTCVCIFFEWALNLKQINFSLVRKNGWQCTQHNVHIIIYKISVDKTGNWDSLRLTPIYACSYFLHSSTPRRLGTYLKNNN